MAHDVKFSIRDRDLGKIDLELVVQSAGRKLGEMHVSKGGIDWYPKYAHSPISYNWTDIAKLFRKAS